MKKATALFRDDREDRSRTCDLLHLENGAFINSNYPKSWNDEMYSFEPADNFYEERDISFLEKREKGLTFKMNKNTRLYEYSKNINKYISFTLYNNNSFNGKAHLLVAENKTHFQILWKFLGARLKIIRKDEIIQKETR